MDTKTVLTPQLHMIRPDLKGLARMELPEGYALRCYREGDERHWSRIIAESFGGTPDKFDFVKIMKEADACFLPERVLFIVAGGEPVATASAYYRPAFMADYGMVHYVGVLPGHTGKKLGYWISLAALLRMREEGRHGAWLSTDDFRLPAIKTYLNLGFEPLLVHENQRERWRKVLAALGQPGAIERFASVLSGPVRPIV